MQIYRNAVTSGLLLVVFYSLFGCSLKAQEHSELYKTLMFSDDKKVTNNNAAIKDANEEIASFKLSTQTFAQGSPDQIENWHENLMGMQKAAYDLLIKKHNLDDTVAKRIASSVVTNAVAGWVSASSSLAMHEGAHGAAATTVGATDIHYAASLTGDVLPNERLTLGDLYLKLLTGQGSDGARTFYGLPTDHTAEDSLFIAAAGLNAQSKFAEQVVEDNWNKESSHFLDTLPYVLNKVAIYSYATSLDPNLDVNDLTSYVDGLVLAGHVTAEDKASVLDKLKNLSIYTTLLSGGMWQGVLSEYNYVVNGDETTSLLGLNTPYGLIALPEFSTYMNKENISLKTKLAMFPKNERVKRVAISYEKDVVGSCDSSELGLDVLLSMGNLDSLTKTVIGSDSSVGITQKLSYKMQKAVSLYGELRYDTGTMDGQRTCQSVDGGACTKAYIGIKYKLFSH